MFQGNRDDSSVVEKIVIAGNFEVQSKKLVILKKYFIKLQKDSGFEHLIRFTSWKSSSGTKPFLHLLNTHHFLVETTSKSQTCQFNLNSMMVRDMRPVHY